MIAGLSYEVQRLIMETVTPIIMGTISLAVINYKNSTFSVKIFIIFILGLICFGPFIWIFRTIRELFSERKSFMDIIFKNSELINDDFEEYDDNDKRNHVEDNQVHVHDQFEENIQIPSTSNFFDDKIENYCEGSEDDSISSSIIAVNDENLEGKDDELPNIDTNKLVILSESENSSIDKPSTLPKRRASTIAGKDNVKSNFDRMQNIRKASMSFHEENSRNLLQQRLYDRKAKDEQSVLTHNLQILSIVESGSDYESQSSISSSDYSEEREEEEEIRIPMVTEVNTNINNFDSQSNAIKRIANKVRNSLIRIFIFPILTFFLPFISFFTCVLIDKSRCR
jgi:hypothetical protein